MWWVDVLWDVLWIVMRNVKCYDWEWERMTRENVISVWSGKLSRADSYPLCEMARLSRVDSLVGGHLIVKWSEKWNEKKCEEKWGNVRLSHPIHVCWELIWIEYDWDWIVLIDCCDDDWLINGWIENCLIESSFGWYLNGLQR